MECRGFISIIFSNYVIIDLVASSEVNNAYKDTKYCQWGEFFVDNNRICANKCGRSKGFIHPIHKRFLCIENEYPIRGSPKLKKLYAEGLYYDCECRHPFIEGMICDHVHVKLTPKQCIDICENTLVLTYLEDSKSHFYCVEVSLITLHVLESVTVNGWKEIGNTGKFYRKPICKCGVNLNQDVERKRKIFENREVIGRRYNKPLKELPHLCNIGGFQLTSKTVCIAKCQAAQVFINYRNELICYHYRMQTEMISSNDEACQCGTIISKCHKDIRYTMPCYPKQIHPKIPPNKCNGFCRNKFYSYIFKSEPKRSVSYCDTRSQPPDGIEGLEFQVGRWAKRRIDLEKERFEIRCSCGLSSLLQLIEKRTNDASSFEASSQENVQNLNETCSSQSIIPNPSIIIQNSDINARNPSVINQISESNSTLVTSRSAIPSTSVTNKKDKNKYYRTRSSFSTALKQTFGANSTGGATSSKVVTTKGTAGNLNRNDIFSQPAIHLTSFQTSHGASSSQTTSNITGKRYKNVISPTDTTNLISEQNLIGNSITSKGVTNQGITPASSSRANLNQRTVRISHGTSPTQAVSNMRNMRGKNASSFPDTINQISANPKTTRGITKQGISENPILCASSSRQNVLNQNNTSVEEDNSSATNVFGDLLDDNSFIDSLDFLSFDIPEIHTLQSSQSINDMTPVEDCDIPSQTGQLPGSSLQMNTSTFVDETRSLSEKNSSANERLSCAQDSTNENANKDDDIFGDILKDVSLNFPQSLVASEFQHNEINNSDIVVVGEYPSPFHEYYGI